MSQDSPILDVLICTYGAVGLRRVAQMGLPEMPGVRYVVSWQRPEADAGTPIPEPLRRSDMEIVPSATRGLGLNRNLSIGLAKAPLCLVADDDLRYTPEQLALVVSTFLNRPDLDVALFRYSPTEKRYPSEEVSLKRRLPKGYYPASVEIAFRRASVAGRVAFPERLGVGTPYPSAEEAFFIHDCRKAGLNCRLFPLTIASHIGASTGARPATPGVMQAEGAYLRHAYPLTGILRTLLLAFRSHRSRRMAFRPALANILRGFFCLRPY